MYFPKYLNFVGQLEMAMAEAFRQNAERHSDEPDIRITCLNMVKQCASQSETLRAASARFPEEPDVAMASVVSGQWSPDGQGSLALLRDLHRLCVVASELEIALIAVGQATQALHDKELDYTVRSCQQQIDTQIKWLKSRIKQAAPQVLIAARKES